MQDAFNSFFILQSFLMTPFILLSVLVNLYVVQLLSRHERLLQEQALYEVNRVYYDQLEQSQIEVRRLRHDWPTTCKPCSNYPRCPASLHQCTSRHTGHAAAQALL